jgi:PAS domain S-box-containing protein
MILPFKAPGLASMKFFSEHHLSRRLIIIPLALIFVAELLVMLLLGQISLSARLPEAILDALLLTLVLFPALYFFVLVPVTAQLRRNSQASQELRASEVRFAAIAATTPDMIHLNATDGRILYANPVTEKLLGYPLDEVVGQHAARFIHPDDLEKTTKHMRGHIEGHHPPSLEVQLLKKDGTLLPVEVNGFLIRDEDEAEYVGAILRDIRSRRQAEAERATQQALTEKLLAERTDHLEKLLNFSRQLATTVEYPALLRKATLLSMELLGLNFSTLMTISDDGTRLIIRDTKGFSESVIGICTLVKGEGLATYVVENRAPATVADFATESRFEVVPMILEHGISSAICVPMMIAGRVFGVLIGHTLECRRFAPWEISLYQNFANQAAVALENATHLARIHESEQKFRTFFEDASDPIFIYALDGALLEINQAACERLGYTRAELLRMAAKDLVAPDLVAMVPERLEIVRNAKQAIFDSAHRAKDGRIIPIELNCRLIDYEGQPAIIGVARDIADRKRAEAALRESEVRYRDLFENATDLIQIVKPDGHFLYVNRAWRERLGYSADEVSALGITDIIDPDCTDHCLETFNQVLSQGSVELIETTFVSKDGRKVLLEGSASCKYGADGEPEFSRCIFRDVTTRRRLEEEAQKSQKLESIGLLAGGIAHDFNNLLTAILGNLALARTQLPADEPVALRLDECEKAAWRARDLTQQLLTFSKGGAPITKAASIRDLIHDSASFMLSGSRSTCAYDLPDDLWQVEIDPGQISQVIQNLVKNADQAMPEGGSIEIRAANVSIAEDGSIPLVPGLYVKLCIVDHGPGIAPAQLTQIFDPYFTTKPQGSGLGLAIAHSIIKNHRGLLSVDSELGGGTTFTLFLPSVAKGRVAAAKQVITQPTARGQGRILVMDDEAIIRNVATKMLEYLGYETETAADGAQALTLYSQARAAGHPFAAVIVDLTIPGGMGGMETMDRLRELDEEVKVIVSSGYANDPIMANYADHGFRAVAPKPYKLQELSAVLKDVLAH